MGEISMSGVRSYDIAEFPEPTGREEVWRFAPRAALKPLLEDAASDAHLTWHATVPAGITVREISAQEARQRAASAPWTGSRHWPLRIPAVRCCWRCPSQPSIPSPS